MKPRMDTNPHECGFHGNRLTRRQLLKVGGLGLLGLTMPGLLRAEEWAKGKGPKARAKSIIFLYQFGGPSHLDMRGGFHGNRIRVDSCPFVVSFSRFHFLNTNS